MVKRAWWWGTSKDMMTRREAAAEPEVGDDIGPDVEPLTTHRKAPAKKDTRRWCKGRVGRKHTLAIAMPPNAHETDCGWHVSRYRNDVRPPQWYYVCRHAEMCTTCGKVFRRYYSWMWNHRSSDALRPEDCPEFMPREI